MGRPPTRPKRFKDGFYIEVRNKGANVGMKIHCDTAHEMHAAGAMYGTSKEVLILGEHKRDRWLNAEPGEEEKRVRKMRLDRPREPKAKTFKEQIAAKSAAKAAGKMKPPKPVKPPKPPKKEKPVKPPKKAKAVKPAKPAKKEKPVAKAKAKKKK